MSRTEYIVTGEAMIVGGQIKGELIRCKDCKYGHLVGSGFCECNKDGKAHYYDWFCADGEVKK